MSKKKIRIAVDGCSSSGKSTLAKQLARKLDYVYIDSGAMYRAVTLFAINNKYIGKDFFDKQQLINNLNKIKIYFEKDKNGYPITFLNGKNVEDTIRKIEVSSYVSFVSEIPEIREYLVMLQRTLGNENDIVMDGRDIGTVVFPDAELKIFVTADLEVRAKRRYNELKSKNTDTNFDEIKKNLLQRDKIDKSRKESPLRQAKDAILIDNTNLNVEEQLELALKLAKSKIYEN